MTKSRIRWARKLAGFFFRAPDMKVSATGVLMISLLLGGSGYVLIFAASAALSAELYVLRGLSRRTAYFILLGSLVLSAVLFQIHPSIAFLLALVFSLNSVGLRAVSGMAFSKSLISAVVLSLLMFAGFLAMQPLDAYVTIAFFFVFSGILLAGLELFFWFAGAPLQKVFGESLLRMVFLVFSNLEGGSKEIELIFKRNSRKTKALVSVIGIRSKKGFKAILIVPFIHPGPFDGIGSSAMPRILRDGLSKKFGAEVFFAKGGCTHDENLASSREIKKVVRTASRLLHRLKFGRQCTGFFRLDGACSVRFGDNAIGVSTAPVGDVALAAGFGFLDEMKKHARDAVYIEAHNSFSEGVLLADSPQYPDLKNSLGSLSQKLSNSRAFPLSAGVARAFPALSTMEGMGRGGVGVVLFKAGGKKFALVFADSNNIAPGVRGQIISAFRRRGISDAEAVSSDSHEINTIIERENPLCKKGGVDVLLKSCLNALEAAEKDLEPCTIGSASDFAGVSVFGAGASASILTAVNKTTFRLGVGILLAIVLVLA